MKNYKYMSLLMALVYVLTFGLTACSDDDDNDVAAPVVELDEANIEGDELCVEADILAEGRTAAIVINIYDATGKTVKITQNMAGNKYIGVRNIDDFHVHVDIAGKNVAVGDLLTLTVTDANGKSTTAKKSITEEEDADEEHHHHD